MAFLAGAVGAAASLLLKSQRSKSPLPLPSDWHLAARNVFSTDERRAWRKLREALPHHVLLSKLPLVRFCQPTQPGSVDYWFELLGSIHVGFAICTGTGRVLAAIDLEVERHPSRRSLQIKRSVLAACGVPYLRCRADKLPSAAELQALVPGASPLAAPQTGASPSAQPDLAGARDALAQTVAARRAELSSQWQDSSIFQDSFFDKGEPDDIVGVVSDHTARSAAQRRSGASG